MAVIYAFPEGCYGQNYVPLEVDEIEIINPLGAAAVKTTNGADGDQSEVTFRLEANTSMHDVVVTATLTRFQKNLTGGSVDPEPAGGPQWQWVVPSGSQPPWEAKWTRDHIGNGKTTEFHFTFNVGKTPGTHLITIRVTATPLVEPAVYQLAHVVT